MPVIQVIILLRSVDHILLCRRTLGAPLRIGNEYVILDKLQAVEEYIHENAHQMIVLGEIGDFDIVTSFLLKMKQKNQRLELAFFDRWAPLRNPEIFDHIIIGGSREDVMRKLNDRVLEFVGFAPFQVSHNQD